MTLNHLWCWDLQLCDPSVPNFSQLTLVNETRNKMYKIFSDVCQRLYFTVVVCMVWRLPIRSVSRATRLIEILEYSKQCRCVIVIVWDRYLCTWCYVLRIRAVLRDPYAGTSSPPNHDVNWLTVVGDCFCDAANWMTSYVWRQLFDNVRVKQVKQTFTVNHRCD